jgi:hypothetical protein
MTVTTVVPDLGQHDQGENRRGECRTEQEKNMNTTMEISSFADHINGSHPHTAAAIGTLLQTVPELKDVKVVPSSTEGFKWDALVGSKVVPLWLLDEAAKGVNALFYTASMFAHALVVAKNSSLSSRKRDDAVHKMVIEKWNIAAPAGYDYYYPNAVK